MWRGELMVKSMTGYGQGRTEKDGISFEVEFKTVNSRYFDLNVRMPRSLIILEDKIRKHMNERIKRGKADLFITYKNYSEDKRTITVDENLAGKYVDTFKRISETYGLQGGVTLDLLKDLEGVFTIEEKKDDPEVIYEVLKEALDIALDSHEVMRKSEGERLKEDILSKKKIIEEKNSAIEVEAPNMVPAFKEKLSERLKELESQNVSEDRIAQEIAIFSDKASIDEEIVRLKSHLEQLVEIIELNEPIGKKLDFLIQEMNREANTMASKSQSLLITSLVLDIKNEIEKMREQIQNIE